MAIFKCKMCGGALEVNNESVATCDYCGTQQTVPKSNDDVISNLFNRANNLRLKCEFDKAAQIYEKIVEQDDSEAEAHWGIVLCKYGIEYVEDPKTLKRIPTCHRTLFEAVTTEADYLAAIDYSDVAQKVIYENEAKAIDKIQKDILSIVKNEKPFDVFICYKETDANGKRTIDSTIANDIYHQLTQEGFKVFYAAITLEDKLGQEYEPYIFAALNSSKVMLVLGTKPEYFSAVWVKNEWSRFMQLMRTDRSKLLIPCYRDMDAYELPEEFAHLQAQDMSKIGFINDVVRGIKKVLKSAESTKTVVKETVVAGGNTNIAPLLKRAFMFLEDGDFNSANEYCEKILDMDPECAEAYLGKLMAELRVKTQEGLKDSANLFDDSSNYQKAVRFADDKLKTFFNDTLQFIKDRNENERLLNIYNIATTYLSQAQEESTLIKAAEKFESISGYNDADILANRCREKAENARKDRIYESVCEVLNDTHTCVGKGTDIKAHEEAITQLQSLDGWKDSEEKILLCQKKIEEIKAQIEKEKLEKERQAELDRIEAEKRAKRNRKIVIIATPIVCAVIAFIIVLNTVIIPNNKYNKAIALMDAGNIIEAYELLSALEGYMDSDTKLDFCYQQAPKLLFQNATVDSIVRFGSYEQDGNTDNGCEPIEWIVLKKEENRVLLISKYILDWQHYNQKHKNVTWETCDLRKWLNDSFYNSAFNENEQKLIFSSNVSADSNPYYNYDPGKETVDKLFIFSIDEAKKYLSKSERKCPATKYILDKFKKRAIEEGADTQYINNLEFVYWYWWLRTPGWDQNNAALVRDDGSINHGGRNIGIADYRENGGNLVDYGEYGVRPAMWIDIDKTNQ